MPVLSFEVQVRHDHNTCPVCPGAVEILLFPGQTLLWGADVVMATLPLLFPIGGCSII